MIFYVSICFIENNRKSFVTHAISYLRQDIKIFLHDSLTIVMLFKS